MSKVKPFGDKISFPLTILLAKYRFEQASEIMRLKAFYFLIVAFIGIVVRIFEYRQFS